MTSVLTYLRLLLWSWAGVVLLASGVCSLLARAFSWNVPQKWFLWVAWGLVLVAGYQAWDTEHRELAGAVHSSRQLTEPQKRSLAQALAGQPHHSVEVKTPLGLTDGTAYADDFAEVFRAVGWEVVRREAYIDPPVFGLWLRANRSDRAADAFAETLANIGVGIPCEYADLSPDRWEFIVGEKPVQP